MFSLERGFTMLPLSTQSPVSPVIDNARTITIQILDDTIQPQVPADFDIHDNVERVEAYNRYSDRLIQKLYNQGVSLDQGDVSPRESSWYTLEILIAQSIAWETPGRNSAPWKPPSFEVLMRSGLSQFLLEVATDPLTWLLTDADNLCLRKDLCRSVGTMWRTAIWVLMWIADHFFDPASPHCGQTGAGSAWASFHGAFRKYVPLLRAHPLLAHPDERMVLFSLSFLLDVAATLHRWLVRTLTLSSADRKTSIELMKTLFVVMEFMVVNKSLCVFPPDRPVPSLEECISMMTTPDLVSICASGSRSLNQISGLDPVQLTRIFVSVINDRTQTPALRTDAFQLFLRLGKTYSVLITEVLGTLDSYFPPLSLLSSIETEMKTESTLSAAKANMVLMWHGSMISKPSFRCKKAFAAQAVLDGIIPFLGDHTLNNLIGNIGQRNKVSGRPEQYEKVIELVRAIILGLGKQKSAEKDKAVDQLEQMLRMVLGRSNINMTVQAVWMSLYTELSSMMGLPAIQSLPRCGDDACQAAGKEDGQPLEYCGRCGKVQYCSRACQTRDWKRRHKLQCSSMRSQ